MRPCLIESTVKVKDVISYTTLVASIFDNINKYKLFEDSNNCIISNYLPRVLVYLAAH